MRVLSLELYHKHFTNAAVVLGPVGILGMVSVCFLFAVLLKSPKGDTIKAYVLYKKEGKYGV